MHHFVTEMCTRVHISVTKYCIVGYGTNVFWDLWDGSISMVAQHILCINRKTLLAMIEGWDIRTIKFYISCNALRERKCRLRTRQYIDSNAMVIKRREMVPPNGAHEHILEMKYMVSSLRTSFSLVMINIKQNGRHFQTNFSNEFSWKKLLEFQLWFDFSEVCSWGPIEINHHCFG